MNPVLSPIHLPPSASSPHKHCGSPNLVSAPAAVASSNGEPHFVRFFRFLCAGWAITGIVLGLRLLAEEHQSRIAARAAPDPSAKAPQALIAEATYWLKHANAAYSGDKSVVVSTFPEQRVEVLDSAFYSTMSRPGYYLLVDHDRKEVVLSIKGTSGLQVRFVCACLCLSLWLSVSG